jgi:hypothetical protein
MGVAQLANRRELQKRHLPRLWSHARRARQHEQRGAEAKADSTTMKISFEEYRLKLLARLDAWINGLEEAIAIADRETFLGKGKAEMSTPSTMYLELLRRIGEMTKDERADGVVLHPSDFEYLANELRVKVLMPAQVVAEIGPHFDFNRCRITQHRLASRWNERHPRDRYAHSVLAQMQASKRL